MTRNPDFTIENHGALFLVKPHTSRAKRHTEQFMPTDVQVFGGGYAVEPSYIQPIVDDILERGFSIA